MRWNDLFGRTLREARPGGGPGASLAQRAALVRLLADEVQLLPLGECLVNRLKHALWRALPPAAAVVLPPGERVSGWSQLLAAEIQSYRQLPVDLSAERWLRGATAQRLGLARPYWTPGLQWLSLPLPGSGPDSPSGRWASALSGWCRSSGLEVQRAERENALGWAVWDPEGPEDFLACPGCGYAGQATTASFSRGETAPPDPAPLRAVATPQANTIRALAEQLGITAGETLKVVFLRTPEDELVTAVLRGDLDVSPAKLERVVARGKLEPAAEALIRSAGLEPGFASPVGLTTRSSPAEPGLWVIGDHSLETGGNFVAGANRPDTHYLGVNYPRDFAVTALADIALAHPGDPCPACRRPLESRRGLWIASWEVLPGTPYTGEDGGQAMATPGLGTVFLFPLLAAFCAAAGAAGKTRWPAGLAPIDLYIVVLTAWDGLAGWVSEIEAAGHRVLVDDRAASAGVKFSDAELIGAPLRATLSARSLSAGGVEILRAGAEPQVVAPGAVVELLSGGRTPVM